MEVLEGYGDSGAYPKRQRKEQDERPSEFDVVQKKTKTENLYQQRLEILANGWSHHQNMRSIDFC